jgi:EpsI family protein
MREARRPLWTAAALAALAVSAWLSNTSLFRQATQGDTDLTRRIPVHIGNWEMVDESAVSESEVRGLETRDVIKRTYFNGSHYMELVVAYIAHSSRKSAHAQEACLRGSGALVGSIEERRMRNSPVSAKLISMDFQDRRHWVCYWYKIGGDYTSAYLKSSLLMFLGGLTGKKSRGASLIRILTPERQGENRESVLVRIEDFTRLLIPQLEKALP